MTQLGKCDTCRARKVKCDETKPVCNACSKKNRPCTYNYGKPSALVREDPPQFSGHGRPRLAPNVVPLRAPHTGYASSSSVPGDLRLTMKREAKGGHGCFQTFAFMKKPLDRRKPQFKQEEEAVSLSSIPRAPSAPSILAAQCMHIFGPLACEPDSRCIYGSWLEAIPSRVGYSPVLDLALEYAINSYTCYIDTGYTTHRSALVSRHKALGSLRYAVANYQGKPKYDMILAIKLHSIAEVFITGGTLGYSTHAIGLSEQLKLGFAAGLDSKSHWALVDHTYIDEVAEAMLTGRPSMFDSPIYLVPTKPSPPHRSGTPPLEEDEASRLIMHCTIQVPRLACLVRRSIEEPSDATTISAACSLSTYLWELSPSTTIDRILEASSKRGNTPPPPEIADLMPGNLHFVSVRVLLLCTRFWWLQIQTCALIQTLWTHMPAACVSHSLPEVQAAQERDIQAATYVAQSLSYANRLANYMPLLPLRMLGPVSLSVGSWFRLAQRISANLDIEREGAKKVPLDPALQDHTGRTALEKELRTAISMEESIIEECNRIHDRWNVGRAGKERFEALIPIMSGGPMPEWMPNRVHWEEARARMIRQGVMRAKA